MSTWFQGCAPRKQQRLEGPGWGVLGDIWWVDDDLPHQPALETQVHFLLGFNRSNFEKGTGNYSKFHLLINGDKRLKRGSVC